MDPAMSASGKPIYPPPDAIPAAMNATPLAQQMTHHAPMPQTGLVHIYMGNGKGKTTASVGLTIRAHAHGLRVLFVQLLKNGLSGEIGILRQLENVRVLSGQADMKFSNEMADDDRARTLAMHREFFETAVAIASRGEIDLLVLDEVFGAIATGLLDGDAVYDFLQKKPAGLEVVLTGRDPEARFLALADYEKGMLAREGIDY
jgi:cob(I)alamin adenosyltransferase